MKKAFHSPRRAKLGQHFLVDLKIRDRIVDSLRLEPTDVVVEIGAGRGFLTEALASRVEKLWAIELDARWALQLKAGFINSRSVTVVEGDVLQLDFHEFLPPGGERRRLRVVGNLPYYITSPILFRLFDFADIIRDATLMVQREVAERVTATPTTRDYGYASLATQLFSVPEFLFTISPSAFAPPPQVHSSVIRLRMSSKSPRLNLEDTPAFLRFAQQIFLEKRKTLLNNLKRMIPRPSREAPFPPELVLVECGLDPLVRAENLSLEKTALLYRALRRRGLV